MEDLSLHILDVAENAVAARATQIRIELREDVAAARLTLRIEDNGCGMDAETMKRAMDPFFTTKKGKRFGLGISLLGQAARQTGGDLTLDSTPGRGTTVSAIFNIGHPDMIPTGDVLATLATLLAGNPSTRFILDQSMGDQVIHFDSRDVSSEPIRSGAQSETRKVDAQGLAMKERTAP